ncbi:MAG: prolyl oligopeptidase family serine peptidase, partial [Leptolyngbyaceae bacterium]|nr:prolyl oligopeptidase family serine peptidase [Leptolyngbyaceae bacterium]
MLNYPQSPKGDQLDHYHGIPVPDPYRWLEEPDSDPTREWIAAQNAVTFEYLESIPERQTIKERLTKLWNYEKFRTPFKKGDRFFYFKNDGLQNQDVLYTLTDLDGEPTVLLDPNTLSEDGTIALAGLAISENARYMAYGLSTAGSDWQDWKIRDIHTGEDLDDLIRWVKFSGAAWTNDEQGFFYSRYDEPNEASKLEDINYFQKLYYHRIGTPQSEDMLVYERPDEKEWGFSGDVTDDGHYLVIAIWKGTDRKNLVFYKDLTKPEAPVVELIQSFDAKFSFIDNDGTRFWFETDLAAPRSRVIEIDISQPERENWREVLAQAEETLQSVSVLNHQFIASYLQNAYSAVKVFTLEGAFVRQVELPGIGSVGGFYGKREDTETFYAFTGFTTPTTVYRYNLITGESTVFRQPTVDFNPADYETKQVFYASKDGTRIPMFITHKKGVTLDGQNPTLLYGYGGFNVSLTPSFSISNLAWMELGGIYAVPNLRGGGEYGEQWHQSGTKLKKQNVFDDFIAAAEWLIANRWTSSRRLAIQGRSNGGL